MASLPAPECPACCQLPEQPVRLPACGHAVCAKCATRLVGRCELRQPLTVADPTQPVSAVFPARELVVTRGSSVHVQPTSKLAAPAVIGAEDAKDQPRENELWAQCPCGRRSAVPLSGADGLERDAATEQRVRELQSAASGTVGVLCAEECGRPAEVQCTTCASVPALCKECFTVCHKPKIMQSHQQAPLGRTKPLGNCLSHPAYPLDAVCLEATCRRPVCAKCALDTHQGHKCVADSAAKAPIGAEIDRLLATVRAALPQLEKLVQELSQRAGSIRAQCQSVRGDVLAQFRLLFTELEALRDRVLQSVDAAEASVLTRSAGGQETLSSARALVSEREAASRLPVAGQLRYEASVREMESLVRSVKTAVDATVPSITLDVESVMRKARELLVLRLPRASAGVWTGPLVARVLTKRQLPQDSFRARRELLPPRSVLRLLRDRR
jgi:hypothetical protein